MRAPPTDLAEAEVIRAVGEGWALRSASLRYVAAGGGSHHWRAGDGSGAAFFVTVDDLDSKDWLGGTRDAVFEGLGRALATAAALRDEAHLRYVVAPIPDVDGGLLRRLGSKYAVALYPFLDGEPYPFGPHIDPHQREQLLDMLVLLHKASAIVAPVALRHTPSIGHRRDLDAVLAEPSRPWGRGPFAAGAQHLVTAHAAQLAELVHAFDRRAREVPPEKLAAVITHGEPHAANTMSVEGRLILFDWDTVAFGPPERDLWFVTSACRDDAACYSRATGLDVDPALLALYEVRWGLDDIASAVAVLRRRHQRTPSTELCWSTLARHMGSLGQWRRALD